MPIQPQLRYQMADWMDDSAEATPHDMLQNGVGYAPLEIFIKVTVTGDESVDFLTLGALTFVERADVFIETAFDQGTLEVGTDGNIDALIDSADYDETSDGAWATNVGSSNADNPNGLFLNAGDTLRITTAGTAATTAAVVYLKLRLYDFTNMIASGLHYDLAADGS